MSVYWFVNPLKNSKSSFCHPTMCEIKIVIYIILLYITTIHHNNNNRYNIIIFDHPMMETSQNASIFTWHVEPRGRGSWRRWRNGLRHWRCGCFGYRLSELSDLDRLARRYLVCIYIIYIMLTNNNVYQ